MEREGKKTSEGARRGRRTSVALPNLPRKVHAELADTPYPPPAGISLVFYFQHCASYLAPFRSDSAQLEAYHEPW